MPGLKVEKMVNGALNEKDGMIDYERELLRQWNNTTNPLSDPTKLFQSVMKKFADKTQSTYQVTFDSGKKVEYDPGADKFNVTLKADQDKVSDQKFCMVFPAEIPTDLLSRMSLATLAEPQQPESGIYARRDFSAKMPVAPVIPRAARVGPGAESPAIRSAGP
jgi:hypothetical protein